MAFKFCMIVLINGSYSIAITQAKGKKQQKKLAGTSQNEGS